MEEDAMRFGDRAIEYEEKAVIQRAVARWTADWVESDLRGLVAVEFGAGPGVFTRYLVGRGFQTLVATDLSRRMVEQGRRRAPGAAWRRLDAWQPGALAVDRLYSCSLLQWVEDPVAAMGRWRACLRGKGRALVSLFIEGSMRELLEGWPCLAAVSWRSASQWLVAMEKAGFRVLRQETFSRELRFDCALEALRSVHAIGAVGERRCGPVELRRRLGEIDKRFQVLGHVPVSWRALKVELVVGGG